jgi:pimeloyl-ACP methyl ester carboxylesterase
MKPCLILVPVVACAVLGSACGSAAPRSEVAGAEWAPLDYANPAHWMCGPDATDDACISTDLTATEILPDGATRRVEHLVATDPSYDCFYLYPTVAYGMATGNDPDFQDHRRVLDPLLQQAARLSAQCRVLAPLYRQITMATYVAMPATDRDRFLERAYVDVAAAFDRYRRHHGGDRPFVLLGHSQGAHLGRRLLERVIAPDPALRERLVAAVLLGGDVLVTQADGRSVNTGGIPMCTSVDQVGCVIAYLAQATHKPPPVEHAPTVLGGVPEGLEPACVHPGAPEGGRSPLEASYFPVRAHQRAFDPWQGKPPPVDTPFVLYRGLYEAECVRDGARFPYLGIDAMLGAEGWAGPRPSFDSDLYAPGLLGLHLLEYALGLGDIMAAIDHRALRVLAR